MYIFQVPFKPLSISDTAKYMQNILNDKESKFKAWKIDNMYGTKNWVSQNWQPRQEAKVDKKIS